MEMQQVRYFIAVARTLNFTRAAEECNVTQPALTRAIKLLEHELGGDLIRREGRHSHLTDLGNKMLPMLTQCYEAALAAKAFAKAVSKGEISMLSIALAQSIDSELVMPSLREMYAAFPGIQLKLKRGSAAEIATMLKAGEVDLAMGGPLGESWDRIQAWPMFTESFDLIVGSDHAFAMRNSVELDVELFREERFLLHSGSDLTEHELEQLRVAGIDCQNAHEIQSSRDLEAMISAGFGVGIAPRYALGSGNLHHLDFAALDLRRTIAVYLVAGRPRTPEATALLNLLRGRDWSAVI